MEKNIMRVGSPRAKKSSPPSAHPVSTPASAYKLLSVLGIIAICVCLIIPMRHGRDKIHSADDAVAVMNLADSSYFEKEKVTHPDVSTSADTDISIFEYIGNVIADLINRVQ